MDIEDRVRKYWDVDAQTYDHSPSHVTATAAERAAWTAALSRHLAPGAKVLDAGAGTGFMSLLAARIGAQVTALDLSTGMLGRLEATASARGVSVAIVEGDAAEPPAEIAARGPFDVVVERHLLWTLPDPGAALAAWRGVAPDGKLLLFEGLWGEADPVESVRGRLREVLRAARGTGPDHHGSYEPDVLERLPLSAGTTPSRLVELVEGAGWGPARLERLRDVEWARMLARRPLDRLLGTTPQFLISAG